MKTRPALSNELPNVPLEKICSKTSPNSCRSPSTNLDMCEPSLPPAKKPRLEPKLKRPLSARETLAKCPRAWGPGGTLEQFDQAEQQLQHLQDKDGAKSRIHLLRRKAIMLKCFSVSLPEQRTLFCEVAKNLPKNPNAAADWLESLWEEDEVNSVETDWVGLHDALNSLNVHEMDVKFAGKVASRLKVMGGVIEDFANLLSEEKWPKFATPSPMSCEELVKACSVAALKHSTDLRAISDAADVEK